MPSNLQTSITFVLLSVQYKCSAIQSTTKPIGDSRPVKLDHIHCHFFSFSKSLPFFLLWIIYQYSVKLGVISIEENIWHKVSQWAIVKISFITNTRLTNNIVLVNWYTQMLTTSIVKLHFLWTVLSISGL